jgi:hypothetical protein
MIRVEKTSPPSPNVCVGEGLKPLLYDKILLKETPMTPEMPAMTHA